MNSRAYANHPVGLRVLDQEFGPRDRSRELFHRFLKFFVASLLVTVALMMFLAAFLSLLPQKADTLLNSDQQPTIKHLPSTQ